MALEELKTTNDILDELYGNISSGQVPPPDTGVVKGRVAASPWTGLTDTNKPVSPPPVPVASTSDILEGLYGKPKGDIVQTRKEGYNPWGIPAEVEAPASVPFPSRTTTPVTRTGEVTPESRGLLEEEPSAVAGGIKDTAEMGLRAVRAIIGGGNETLTSGIEALKAVEETTPLLKPSSSSSPITQAIYGGIRSTIPSIASGIPGKVAGAALGASIGGPIGAWTGYGIGAGIQFGLAEYDRFREEGIKQGLPPETVHKYAVMSGLVEGVVETAANIVGARIFGLDKFIKANLTLPIRTMIKQAMVPSAGKFIKNYIKDLPVEVGTEMIQGAIESWLRHQAGITTETTPWEEARDVIGPTMVMTALFSISARVYNASQAKSLQKILNGM